MRKHRWKHKKVLNRLFRESDLRKRKLSDRIMGYLLLGLFNFGLMMLFGFFTLDSFATFHSRVGGLLISFLLPMFIVSVTRNMSRIERFLKFGSGLIIYLIIGLVRVMFPAMVTTFLFPCIVIALLTLYYGDIIYKIRIAEDEDELV